MCKRIFANQTAPEGEVPFYKIGTIGDKADAYISKELFDEYKLKYNYPKCGEVMITCAGTVGKTILYNGQDAYYQDSNIVWLSNPKNFYSNAFLNYLLNRVDWSKLNSTTITRIYNDNLRELHITFPSRQEQDRIVSLLTKIDERITVQSKIIEEQETLLKSLADKLISAQLANVALCECVEAKASTMKESELDSSGEFPVYGASGLCGFCSDALEESDSILITKDGSGVGTCQYATEKHSFLGTLCSLTAKENVYLPYIYYALLNFNFALYKTGQAIPHIYFKDYGKATIYCPSYVEQIRIASGLQKLDAKINADIELLRKYRLQKEFLLSRMFI